MNGDLTSVVKDAERLVTVVFDVYGTTAREYERAIGPIVSPEQQKVVLEVALACVGIANKESRMEKMRAEKRNAVKKPRIVSETTPDGKTTPIALDDPVKPRDERDRPTEQLIQELGIKTPKQAGFLRYKKEISYKEWQRVRDVVSRREIAGGALSP